ncbi:MAG: phosphoribosylglycinamide formyltransferase [Candidatus Poseidoniaceae archaeon]
MATSAGTTRVATAEDPLRCAILISGSGSGMQAMLEHQKNPNCAHITTVVVSNKSGVKGIERAKNLDVPTVVVEVSPNLSGDERRITHELEIEQVLFDYEVELVILSGYMRLLSPQFVERWEGKIVNIHPSLLPDFPGAHAHRDVIASGVRKSGCTVHYVDAGMDTGQIIAQCEVEVLPEDTEETLASRIKHFEHILYPMVIDAIASGDFSNLQAD